MLLELKCTPTKLTFLIMSIPKEKAIIRSMRSSFKKKNLMNTNKQLNLTSILSFTKSLEFHKKEIASRILSDCARIPKLGNRSTMLMMNKLKTKKMDFTSNTDTKVF